MQKAFQITFLYIKKDNPFKIFKKFKNVFFEVLTKAANKRTLYILYIFS